MPKCRNAVLTMLCYRKSENVNRAVDKLTSKGLSVIGIKCHVGDAADRANLFRETIKRFGGLDILVSNAATNPVAGPILDCSERAWDKIFEVNVKASFLLAKESAPLIRKRGGGSIIFISSVAGYNPNKVEEIICVWEEFNFLTFPW